MLEKPLAPLCCSRFSLGGGSAPQEVCSGLPNSCVRESYGVSRAPGPRRVGCVPAARSLDFAPIDGVLGGHALKV